MVVVARFIAQVNVDSGVSEDSAATNVIVDVPVEISLDFLKMKALEDSYTELLRDTIRSTVRSVPVGEGADYWDGLYDPESYSVSLKRVVGDVAFNDPNIGLFLFDAI
jgi:hypothetical protein